MADPDQQALRLVQQVGLLLLRRWDETLRELGLDYFLDAGTLLGSVRGAGWIAWDDDIDVAMKRPDLHRLLEALAADPGLFGPDVAFDPGDWDLIPRLRYLPSSTPNGPISLDIWVQDLAPDPVALRRAWNAALSGLRIALASAAPVDTVPRRASRRFRVAAVPLRPPARRLGDERLRGWHRQLISWGASHSSGGLTHGTNQGLRWNRDLPATCFEPGNSALFEGRRYPIPNEPDAVLRRYYGPDFAQPHPPGQRPAPHYTRPMSVLFAGREWRLD